MSVPAGIPPSTDADGVDGPVGFYSRHPISAAIILAKLRASRGNLDAVRPEELWPHDQDHYGGLGVNAALAARAGLRPGLRVADFCAGLGGPARWMAVAHGVDVTGIELTPARVAGAAALTQLVGLADRVRVLQGDVMQVPLTDASVDVVVSQEAFLHVPDKARVLAEACRVLRPGGRLAFTDWVLHRPLAAADAALLWQGFAAQALLGLDEYRLAIARAGFRLDAADDLTAEWGTILAERLAMYRALRGEAERAGTPVGHDAFYRGYALLVALVQARALGGARFAAAKP